MSRIHPVDPPYDAELQAAFDAITPPGQTPLLLFRTLGVSRRVYQRFRAGGLLDRGPLSLRHREIIILRICALNRCEYEWGVHVSVFAVKAGFTDEQVASTVDARCAAWNEAESALLAACEEMDRGTHLGDAAWSRLRGHFDEQQVLEVVALAGFYRMVCLHANVLQLPPEPFAARFPV